MKNQVALRVFLLLLPMLFSAAALSAQEDETIEIKGEVFKVVEEMPRFPGCEEIEDMEERKRCAQEKMLEYVYYNIGYPEEAVANEVEGFVVVQFVVEKDGSISDVKVVRDIGAGCGEEAARVVNSMPDWIPGKMRGRSVRVQFNLPVKYALDDGEKKKKKRG